MYALVIPSRLNQATGAGNLLASRWTSWIATKKDRPYIGEMYGLVIVDWDIEPDKQEQPEDGLVCQRPADRPWRRYWQLVQTYVTNIPT